LAAVVITILICLIFSLALAFSIFGQDNYPNTPIGSIDTNQILPGFFAEYI